MTVTKHMKRQEVLRTLGSASLGLNLFHAQIVEEKKRPQMRERERGL